MNLITRISPLNGNRMTPIPNDPVPHGTIYEYVCIERYISTFIDAQALKLALTNGLIDFLFQSPDANAAAIAETIRIDGAGVSMLLHLLAANRVVSSHEAPYRLTPEFTTALKYRALMESKIDFANLVCPDLQNRFDQYIGHFDQFMQESKIFDLFTYRRCYEITEENMAVTRTWMRFTTAVTMHEALVCMDRHDFGRYRSLLDIGGNSGEFALQLTNRHPRLAATVFDLPVVCEVGKNHVKERGDPSRIRFIGGDALVDTIEGPFDAVSFKSFLHDWPEPAVAEFLAKAYRCLGTEGTVIIFERGPLDFGTGTPSFAMIPVMLFHRNFREPECYLPILRQAGFSKIIIDRFNIETPFFIIHAKK